ncbi:MAG: hypothetical protein KDN18_19535, partial [Verrucomicrobiae bacterium]|nr:hypothetical protein [Verrucomicrobiae bacterium]
DAISLITRWIASLDPASGPVGPVLVKGPPDYLPPSGVLTSPSGRVIYGPTEIRLRFNEPVAGFTEDDLAVSNGSISRLSGTNGDYAFLLTPSSPGPLNVSIPSDRLTDLNGNANPAVPELWMEYREPVIVSGWRYDYYESHFTRLPDYSSLVPDESGVTATVGLSPRQRDDHFGLRFYGDLRVEGGGEYEFTLESDEGSRLWIDRNLLIDLDGLHKTATRKSRVLLEPGLHQIELAYFEREGDQTLALTVSGPGIAEPSLPPELMSHRADPGPLAGRDPAIQAFFYPPATFEGEGRHRRAYQPDQWIGKNRGNSSGDNIYNLSTRGQSWKTRLSPTGTVRFLVTLQNDRTVSDNPLVHSSRLLRAERRLCRVGKKNVTAALVSGRLRIANLEPGEVTGIQVSSRWSNETVSGRTRMISFTATSASPGISGDRVGAVMTPRQRKRP